MIDINDLKQEVGNLKANLEKIRKEKIKLRKELEKTQKDFAEYKSKVDFVYSSVFDAVRIIESIED